MFGGFQMGIWQRVTLDGGFMLLFVGAFICLLSLVVFIRMFRQKEPEQPDSAAVADSANKKLLYTLLFTAAGLLVMQYVLGTILTLIAFLILWLKVYCKIAWPKTLILTTCVMTIIYSIFVLWLKVRFPTFLDLGIL